MWWSLLFLPLVLGACPSPGCAGGKCPTTNPVGALYKNGTYPWADVLVNWTCVVSVADFKSEANSDDARVQAAITAVKDAPGGGVVYFPKGSYTFTKNIELPSHVVLRGDLTTAPANNGGKPGSLAPTATLTCPDRMHLGIFNEDKNATSLGVVNLAFDGCAVMLRPQFDTSDGSLKSWFTASKVLGMGSKKLVLGCKSQNCNFQDKGTKTGNPFEWAFSHAIAAYGDSDVLVANNLVAESSRKATIAQKWTVAINNGGCCQRAAGCKDNKKFATNETGCKAAGCKWTGQGSQCPESLTFTNNKDYQYDSRYGIDVNQILLGGANGKTCPGFGQGTPACFPFLYRPGLIIVDNYVYQNGRVGISFSGGGDGKTPGSGTIVSGNHVEVKQNTMYWTPDGNRLAKGTDTNENRGFDVKGNENHVFKNTARTSYQSLPCPTAENHLNPCPFHTVDCEGILMQQSAGGPETYRNVWEDNDTTGSVANCGPIWFYTMPKADDNQLTNNKLNAGAYLGVVLKPGDEAKGNVCTGNSHVNKCNGP